MRGSFVLPFILLCVWSVLGADNQPLRPNVRETVRQCDIQALWFDIIEDSNTDVFFELGFTAVQAASFSVTIVKKSFNDKSNLTIVDHALDCSHVKLTVKPEEVNVLKKQDFGCGDLNGRWWVVVKHDAQVPRDFVVSLNTRTIKRGDELQLVPFPVGRTKDEARILTLKNTSTNPLNRFAFYNIQIPTFTTGSRILIEVRPVNGKNPMSYLSYNQLPLPNGCNLQQSDVGNFELGYCQASRSGTWMLTIETEINIEYRLRAFLLEPVYQDIRLDQKYTATLLRSLDTLYFRLPPSVWTSVGNITTDSLVPVVDNVINGRVRLGANYDEIPFDTCRSYSQQCVSDMGCHLILGPCDHKDRHDRTWIFGVEALKFQEENVPITITFSVKVSPYVLRTIRLGMNSTQTGALDNGILSEYLLPPSAYLAPNATGSWLSVGVYVDAAKRLQERGGTLNGYLYISDKPFAGPNEGCYSNKKFCSIASTKTDYMSCSLQLDPCDLRLFKNGIYLSLLAIDATDELWYQDKLPFTLHVETEDPQDKNKFWLDDGDVITDTITEGHYKFYYVPPHRGSLTVSITSPWERPTPTPELDCTQHTQFGVKECIEMPGCGWCNAKCVPCSGKIGQSVVCDVPSIIGCAAAPTPTPTPAPTPSNRIDDPCATLESSFCSDANLAGVCGWCSTLQQCGSCTRTLPPESWCGASIPTNCQTVRNVISKREEQQTYGQKEVRLIVIYGDKVEGPSCPCWKPSQSVDIRKGETIHRTVTSCATDLSKGLYVAVQGIVPTPSNTAWTCIPGYTTPVRINGAGVAECMSFNGKECYWNDGPCTANKLLGNGSPIITINCLDIQRQIGSSDSYTLEGKWCADTLKYFTDKFHYYTQSKYVLSIEQAPVTEKQQVTTLAPNVVQEGQLNVGDVHYYELIFERKELRNYTLIIDARAHANSGFEITYGILKGQAGPNYDCLELDEPQVCVPSDKNKGQCIFLYSSCNWRNDKDNRRMMVQVRRKDGVGESGPTDLYNINYVLSVKAPQPLQENLSVANTIFAREYSHFIFDISKDKVSSHSLVIEVYFDASREVDPSEQLELFLNNPTTPELAGDLNDCYCHQSKWSHGKKIVATISPCELIEGKYRFSVRTNAFTRDSFRAKFTIVAYTKKTTFSPFPWDTLTDGSLYVDQSANYLFTLPQTFISGDRNGYFNDPHNILTFRLYSTRKNDLLTMTLRGAASCQCSKQALRTCTTQEDVTGRPYCEFTMEYCQFPVAENYTLSINAKSANDLTNPVPYTLAALKTNKAPIVEKLTSADSCSTADRSATSYFQYFVIEPDGVQHVNLTFKNKGANLIPQIYLDGVKFGTVVVSTNTPKRFATPECRLSNLPSYYCSQPNCVIKLGCGDDVGMISLKAIAAKANQPVVAKLSVCSGTVAQTRFTGTPKSFSLAPFGFEIIEIVRFALVDGSVWSAIFNYDPDVPADGKVTLTINQGMCSTCRGFTRTKICVGPCQIEIHYWELPLNYDKSDWIMQVSNENSYPLSFTLTSTRSVLRGATNLVANTPVSTGVPPLGWAYYRYVVTPPNYWQGLEIAEVNLLFAGAGPDATATHGVMYGASTSPPTVGAKIKLVDLPVAGKLFELGKCCVASQTFYILVFNSNPSTLWTINVTTTFNQLSLHTSLPWADTRASGKLLARPQDSRPAADRAYGPINYQSYINFPGVSSRDGVFATGTYLRGYANRDRSINPSFPSNIHLYMNTNTPAGPAGSCFSNLYYERSPEFWSKQWFHCETQTLGIASYWFGIVNTEVGGDLSYNVGLERIDPVPKDFAVEFVDRAPPQEWKQYEYVIDRKAALGVRYVLDVEVRDNFGAVKVAMNLEGAAAEESDNLPCAKEWLANKVAKAYKLQVQQCDTYLFNGEWVRVCYPITLTGPGKMIYDSCQLLTVSKGTQVLKQPAKKLYLGIKPYCNIQAQPDPTFAATSRCTATGPDNPTYAVKLSIEDTYAGTRVTLNDGVAYRLNRYIYQDANTALFRYQAPPGAQSSQGFIVVEVTAINDNAPLAIGWSTDGCNFNRNDTVCTTVAGPMRCTLIVYPCSWQSGATYDLLITAPTTATTGFTVKVTAETDIARYTTNLYPGDSATVAVNINELKFFRVDLTSDKGIPIEPSDRIIVEMVEVGCGTVNAWVNRETPGGPTCNVNPGGKPCSTSTCVLVDINACEILNSDFVFEYYVSVVGVARTSTETIKVKLRVRIVKGSQVPYKTRMIYDNEEHPIWANAVIAEPQCAGLSERKLATQDDCCSLTPPLAGANDTRVWRVADTHFVYTINGGHHFGNGAGAGTRFTVGLKPEVESALVYFITDKAKFCDPAPPTPCRVTEIDRCVFEIRTCRQTVRQMYIWIDPASVRWYNPSGRPNVPLQQNVYQIGWVRATKQDVGIVSVKQPDNTPPGTPIYHPFWLMPGEITYLKIDHPAGYAKLPNYHVRIAVDGVTNGPITIAQASGWNSCTDGECVVQDCQFGDLENDTDYSVGACRKKTVDCHCQSLKDVSLPVCLTEAADDDQADYFQLQMPRTGTNAVYGRLKITVSEVLQTTNSSVCHKLHTGQNRYFRAPALGGPNYIYKFTVYDMEDDFGGVRMTLNDDSVAISGTCADKGSCYANGGSCTLWYRKGLTVPGVTITADAVGKTIGLRGNHKFKVDLTSVEVQVYDLKNTITSVSPTMVVDGSCLKPIAPQYYRMVTRSTDGYVLFTVVSHVANVWITRGSLSHARGNWNCDTRKKGFCEILIACSFKGGDIFYVHVEGGAHEITASSYAVNIQATTLGETKQVTFTSPQPYAAFLIKGVEGRHLDPSRYLEISVAGPVLDSWITRNAFGSQRCKVPFSFLTEKEPGNVLNKQTSTHRVPSCYVGVQSDAFYLNILSVESECDGYIYNMNSRFSDPDGALIVNGIGPGKVPAGGVTRHRVDRSILKNPLGDKSVLLIRVADASAPVESVVLKSNYLNKPGCQTPCSSVATTDSVFWLDNCWHCGNNAYDTVFVEVTGKHPVSSAEIVFNLGVEHKTWDELSLSWIEGKFSGVARDFHFFGAKLKKDSGMMLEVEVLGNLGVDIDIFPADCSRRNLNLALADQSLKYRCYRGETTCQIPFSKEHNWGSSSSQANYIWSDDNIRIVVKGYQTTFRIRVRRSSAELCTPITEAHAPFCAKLIPDGTAWGNPANFGPKDTWAERWHTKLVSGFDCPASRNCDCVPVSDNCRAALKEYACASTFGRCTANGWKTAAHVAKCRAVEQACFRTFIDAGFPLLDCRHSFYEGARLLTDGKGCALSGCPPEIPPEPVPAPEPRIPYTPEPEIIFPEPSHVPEPANATEPETIEDSGLALVAILGIVLGVASALLVVSIIIFFVKRHFAMAA